MSIKHILQLPFLELDYNELEELNTHVRSFTDAETAKQFHAGYLNQQPGLKEVTICFSDIEGVLHTLDYDKKYLLRSLDNLTFDGSSVRGFADTTNSDLKLQVDWCSVVYPPKDIFGLGKVLVFANLTYADGEMHPSNFRGRLQAYASELRDNQNLVINMAPEIEGFLLQGIDAEQHYDSREGFKLVSSGGYYHSLPLDELKQFIDRAANGLRAMGFQIEKDHPEVAPSQFEINFSYTDVVRACDQAQLYKLLCRQIAMSMGKTATFLPKPVQKINGSGMHINLSLSSDNTNLFYDPSGELNLSPLAWQLVNNNLLFAKDLCLIFCSSVNAYRRLDPHYEAPNQIKASAADRAALVRVPAASSAATRVEFRSVAPDANIYLTMYAIVKTGLASVTLKPETTGPTATDHGYLPATIDDALSYFASSSHAEAIFGAETKEKYLETKTVVAGRSPKELGQKVKTGEVIYHHEVTNQELWSDF